MVNRAGFIPMLPLRGNLRSSTNSQLNPNPVGSSAITNSKVSADTAVSAARGQRKKKDRLKQSNINNTVRSIFGSGDDSSSSSDSFTSEDRRTSFPIDSSRSSSIKFNFPVKSVVATVTDDYLYKGGGQKSVKQHLSLSSLLPDSYTYSNLDSKSLVKDQFNNVYDRWTTQIQEIRLNTNMYSFWTIDLVYKYIWVVVQSLSIYVCLDSILAIDEPVGEVNRVNTVMKSYYADTDLLIAQDKLRQKLKNQWLPPEMRDLILWLYQLYKTSDIKTCIQYRFVPHDSFIKVDSADNTVNRLTSEINSLLVLLDSADLTRVRSILRSSLPSGCINRIPHACNQSTFDRAHHELYANQPVLWKQQDGTLKTFPLFSSDESGYAAYGMSVDPSGDNGFAFALSQSFKSGGYQDSDIFNTKRHSRVSVSFLYGTNDFSADPTNFNGDSVLWTRNTEAYHSSHDEVGHLHSVEISSSTGVADRTVTATPFGYQRVYFNSFNQRLLVAKEMFRRLLSAN